MRWSIHIWDEVSCQVVLTKDKIMSRFVNNYKYNLGKVTSGQLVNLNLSAKKVSVNGLLNLSTVSELKLQIQLDGIPSTLAKWLLRQRLWNSHCLTVTADPAVMRLKFGCSGMNNESTYLRTLYSSSCNHRKRLRDKKLFIAISLYCCV